MPNVKVEGIPRFWQHVRDAQQRLLALDYDGTLAPFRIERMKAKPLPGTMVQLEQLVMSGHTRVVLISGRPLAELAKLVGKIEIEMVGVHGFEWRSRDGHVLVSRPDHYQTEGLASAFLRAQGVGLKSRLEKKSASVAFHSRGTLDGSRQNATVRSLWLPVAMQYGLDLRDFDGGVEIRATTATKGTALAKLLQTEPDRTLAVYIGDDETDEDAFIAIRERGIGIKVGGYGLRTAAAGRLPNCEAVRDFLRSWYELTCKQR